MMGETTAIAWCDHTFNPWWGCTRVSPACDFCYAEAFDKRVGGAHWGKGVPRREFGEKHWNEPLKWDRAAAKVGARSRVFCASMADVFDSEVPEAWRVRLFELIRATPNLDWQLLTKRPHNIVKMLPLDWGGGWPNVWMGTTVENQHWAELRVPVLLAAPARVRFLSVEPMLGPVDLTRLKDDEIGADWNALEMGLDWVICGGESGHHARPMDLSWARSLGEQCAAHDKAFFFKQTGSVITGRASDHGSDPARWPVELRVQEFPEVFP